jgi:LysR family transcriptional regulator, nod-box dependent transcriptional activator
MHGIATRGASENANVEPQRRLRLNAGVNLRQFDLNLLVALDALLTERNVTRAGERLFLSQPAMSGTLSRLRHVFHDELLVRAGRELQLTELAAGLASPVHECVQQIEALLNARVPFAPENERRCFRIAASDYVVLLTLRQLSKSLTEVAPNISLQFCSLEPSVADQLATGDIDFAVLPAEFDLHLPSVPLFDDSWVCAVRSGHPHEGERFTSEEFLALPHLSFRFAGPEHGSVVENYLVAIGCQRKVVASSESLAMAPFLLQGTPFVTLIPRRLGERVRQAADIKLIEPPFDVPPLRETLFWSPRFTASPAHAWFRERFCEAAQAM